MNSEYHSRVSPRVRRGGRWRLVHSPPMNTAYTTIPATVVHRLHLLHLSLCRNAATAPIAHNAMAAKANIIYTSQPIISLSTDFHRLIIIIGFSQIIHCAANYFDFLFFSIAIAPMSSRDNPASIGYFIGCLSIIIRHALTLPLLPSGLKSTR